MTCTRKVCRKLPSIELEMYKQYVDELRVKRAVIFEARNVQNGERCENIICTQNMLQIKEYWPLDVQTVYGRIAREARRKFWC